MKYILTAGEKEILSRLESILFKAPGVNYLGDDSISISYKDYAFIFIWHLLFDKEYELISVFYEEGICSQAMMMVVTSYNELDYNIRLIKANIVKDSL